MVGPRSNTQILIDEQQTNMNPPAAPLGRPPSYQPSSSPMPPPINTGAGGHNYPPQGYGNPTAPPGYPVGAPSGYGYPTPAPQGPHAYGTRSLAEVEGSNRSKAQLIVGIDFVRYGTATHGLGDSH